MALDHRDSAAEELRRIEDYRKSFRQSTRFDDRFACRMLAGTYLLGFGGQYLAMILFPSFADKSGTVLMTVGSCAVFVVFRHSLRQHAGISGRAIRKSIYFGSAWLVCMAVVSAVIALIVARLPGLDVIGVTRIVYAVACVLTGFMYIIGGILFHDRSELSLGGWLIVVSVFSALLGMPLMLLSIAVLSALGFLGLAFVRSCADQRAAS